MRRMMVTVAAATLASVLSAQTSWLVGPSGLPTIQAAIDGANTGDEILVQPGVYPAFYLNKGLTIRAVLPGTVDVQLVAPFPTIHLLMGEQAHLVGLNLDGYVWVILSDVTFEQCEIRYANVALDVSANSRVYLLDCLVEALPNSPGWPTSLGALEVSSSTVTAIGTTLRGNSAAPSGASRALRLSNSQFYGSDLTIDGGLGSPAVPAITADANSSVSISDSVVTAEPSTCPINAAVANCDRCTLTTPCPLLLGQPLLGVRQAGSMTRGQSLTVEFLTTANQPVLVFGSTQTQLSWPVALTQPFALEATGCYPVIGLVSNAAGAASVTWNLPVVTLPPSAAIWLQGVSGTSLPLRASALAGGVVR